MEAEYVALSTAVKEVMWNIYCRIGYVRFVSFELWIIQCTRQCDNRAAIDFSKNHIEKGHTKHIDIAHHIVREKLDEKIITLFYIASKENPADIMTKPLRRIADREGVRKLKLGVTKVGD